MVYYVMALALYAQASYGEVLRCLLEGIRWLRLHGVDGATAGKSAITKARIRLGVAPLRELYRRVARPLALPGTCGAWYRGRRLVSFDGTTIDLADLPELEARFGRPGAAHGSCAFPQLRLLGLGETGTRAMIAMSFDRYDVSEVRLAERLWNGWSGECCVWRIAAFSATSCGNAPAPRVPICCGGPARMLSCRPGRCWRMAPV